MRVLLVEDDPKVVEVVRLYLEAEGFEAEVARTGEEALRAIDQSPPDLVVLDIRLPGIDGWTVARRLRQQQSDLPLIILTSSTDESDRLLGFELGADDYVPKPFSPRELVARIKAVRRRAEARSAEAPHVLRYPGLLIDADRRVVERDGEPVELTRREYDLLWKLASSPGRVMTRDALYESVWGDEAYGDLHTLEVHVNRLRSKIERPGGARYLVTVRGVGYKFEASGHG